MKKSPLTTNNSFQTKRKVEQSKIIVRVATSADLDYAQTITDEMAASAQVRGTGIAKRSTEYIQQKIQEGKAVIAVTEDGAWVGFCYIEAWGKEICSKQWPDCSSGIPENRHRKKY